MAVRDLLGSNPLPSSVMRRRTAFGVRRISRRTSWAPACLTTLWRASWAIRYSVSSTGSGSRSSSVLSTTTGSPIRPCSDACGS